MEDEGLLIEAAQQDPRRFDELYERSCEAESGSGKEGCRPSSRVRTITSYLSSQGPEFIDFLKRVFGAEETFRGEFVPGRLLVEVRIGDSMLIISVGESNVPTVPEVHVPNVDEVYQRAIDAGCAELQAIQNAHWEPIRLGCVVKSS